MEDSPPGDESAPSRLARRVRLARHNRQLSIAELAERTELSPDFLQSAEDGTIDPSQVGLGDLEVLAKALGVEESDLFRRDT